MIKLTDLLKEVEEQKYTIYCDMDGVLVDFDKGYANITGIETHHANLQGNRKFWDILRKKLEEKEISEKEFWATLPKKTGCDELWSYISQYNCYILTAPSTSPESREGKIEWVKNNLSPQPIEIIFKNSGEKHEVLNDKTEEEKQKSILIDDFYKKNVKPFKDNGGYSIYYSSNMTASTVIKQLKKLVS